MFRVTRQYICHKVLLEILLYYYEHTFSHVIL
ncbi:unnamed protein product [Brugia pahangi]|uniref:Uncharacterized protein n=1 Tax=Brugia pahangi TaxID=6280 RepID=A0A0N4TDF8_BRUPA|nr:unnamed protein product [Brugia pahangi]